MLIAVIILSIVVVVVTTYLLACIAHIKAIQKELEDIGKELSAQNNLINRIVITQNDMVQAMIADVAQTAQNYYIGPQAEA